MAPGRWTMAATAGGLGLFASVALAAAGTPAVRQGAARHVLRPVGGSFTPAAADPRLAAAFARAGMADVGDFRFTPADSRQGRRVVTVAVRMRGRAPVSARIAPAAAVASNVGIAPVAYNLGVGVGWRSFAVTGELARIDLGPQPGGREAADVALSVRAKRFTGRLKAATDRPIGEAANLIGPPQGYSLDLGGSYSLTRRLDVTAGVRYRSDRDRNRMDDDRHDSQAAYLGTVFRF